MTAQKRDDLLGFGERIRAEQKVVFILQNTCANIENRNTSAKLVCIKGDYVLVCIGRCHYLLLFADAIESGECIAAFGSLLIAFRLCVRVHLSLDLTLDVFHFTTQEFRGIAHGCFVLFGSYLARANAGTTPHLVINARALATNILWKSTRTRRKPQSARQKFDERICRSRTRIGAVVTRFVFFSFARKNETGILLVGDFDIGIGLCILEADVVFGIVLLDEGILQRKRLHLVVANVTIEIINRRDHSSSLGILFAVLKILRYAGFELARFAHVNDLAAYIAHNVNARAERQIVCLLEQAAHSVGTWCHTRPPFNGLLRITKF